MTPYHVIMAIQYVAILLLLGALLFACSQKPSEPQKHVIILSVSCIIMFAGYIIEIQSHSLEEALTGVAVSYMGKPFVMMSSFLLICSYFRKKIGKGLVLAMGIVSVAFCLLIFSNEYHHLYYATTSFVEQGTTYSPLQLTHGPLYYAYVAATIIYFLGCLYVIITCRKKAPSKQRNLLVFFSVMMVFCGLAGYMVYLLWDTNGYDSTMLGVLAGVVFLFLIFLKCRIFDTLSFAKDFALEDSPIGFIVINSDGELIYKNQIANKICGKEYDVRFFRELKEKHNKLCLKDKVYDISVKELIDSGQNLGKAYQILDITHYHNYQERLEMAVQERTEKLEVMQREIIASVANIVEARSLETGEHIARTSTYAQMIAKGLRELGLYQDILTEDYITLMVSAAPLHDIGKVSVPDAILLKPGKLTTDEFEIMKTHVDIGAQIIENTLRGLESEDYVKMAYDIAKYHHERWDGKGYSQKLSGKDIPLSARIVALADCFDAITSKRCYKDAVEREKAIEIIQEESGTHFDPDIVKAFLLVINRI